MNTYRLADLNSGRLGIEWFADGQSQGLAWGSYADIADALDAVIEFVRMEKREAPERYA